MSINIVIYSYLSNQKYLEPVNLQVSHYIVFHHHQIHLPSIYHHIWETHSHYRIYLTLTFYSKPILLHKKIHLDDNTCHALLSFHSICILHKYIHSDIFPLQIRIPPILIFLVIIQGFHLPIKSTIIIIQEVIFIEVLFQEVILISFRRLIPRAFCYIDS